MEVQVIENKELLESVEPFEIANLLWGTEKIAKTYGYIGFVPEDELYLKLVCLGKNPFRVYKEVMCYENLQSKRLQGHEQKSGKYYLCAGDHEAELCIGAGDWINTDWNL